MPFDLEVSDGFGRELDKAVGAEPWSHWSLSALAEWVGKAIDAKAVILALRMSRAPGEVRIGCAGDGVAPLEEHFKRVCGDGSRQPCFIDMADGPSIAENLDIMREGWSVVSPTLAKRCEVDAVLAARLVLKGKPAGVICAFRGPDARFTGMEKRILGHLAMRTEAALREFGANDRAMRLESLKAIMLDLISAETVDSLLEIVLDRSLKLVGVERGWISRLDFASGQLAISYSRGSPGHLEPLENGKGITWKALADGHPIRVNDVSAAEWRDIYAAYWPDTRSELAVPLILESADVRVRTELKKARKPLCVLNLESRRVAAFSEEDEILLDALARYAAVLVDGADYDARLATLAEAQQALSATRDEREILELVAKSIERAEFDCVNVSLMSLDRTRIKTEYVLGIPKERIAEFKRRSDHELSSNDIQARIVREGTIEVPDASDPGFDQNIYHDFGHQNLTRVFLPIIASSGIILGTVEAGYRRAFLKVIYEQDIRLLKGFVDYAARTIELRGQFRIEALSHELNGPLAGIRSNADFLLRRFHQLEPDSIRRKLEAIMVDSEIMQVVAVDLEYLLRGRVSASVAVKTGTTRQDPTLVFRDVVLKIVRQLTPLVKSVGLNPDNISVENVRTIPPLDLDQARLNQVFYNLFLNAIKYAGPDPKGFRIEIEGDAEKRYAIRVSDWGIGIQMQNAALIFDDGYRTPEAKRLNSSGSGLGLTISRKLMREMGGDLKLINNTQPTTFEVVLPARPAGSPRGGSGIEVTGRSEGHSYEQ